MNSGCYRAFRRLPALPLAVLLTVLLPACKSIDVPKLPGVTPYRMVIQQGNFISQEMVAQLKPGMTKEQVRFVLGTPLVTDIFHADRWDYVYYREPASGKKEQRNLSVVFEKDRLARVIGDLMPAEGSPQAGGFDPQVKPAKPASETAKPAAEAPKPAAAAAKPAGESWEPTKSNWSAAPAEPEKTPEAVKAEAAAAAEEPKKPEPETPAEKPAEEKGFFSRMLEKIGL